MRVGLQVISLFSLQLFLCFPQSPNHWGIGGDRNLLYSGQLQEDLCLTLQVHEGPSCYCACVYFFSLPVGSY